MKKSILFTWILIIFITNPIWGGSYYQIYSLGEFHYITQADMLGRGGTSIAIPDAKTINSVNPAGLIFVQLTRISADFIHQKIDMKAKSGIGLSNYANLNGVKLLVPLATNKLVVSLGIKPYSQRDFKMESKGELSTENEYLKQIVYKGGLNQASFGVATNIMDRVYAGMFLNYNFGRIEENWKVDFVSDLFYDTSDKISSTVWGGSATLGLMVKVTPEWYLGAIYSHSAKLSLNNQIKYTFGNSSETEHRKMQVPYSWGIGTSYLLRFVRLSMDFFSHHWSDFKVDNIISVNVTDGYNFSTGIELLPSTKFNVSYIKKMTYQIGFSYGKLGNKDIYGNNVNEYMGTFGIGLPFYERFGRINLAFGIGKRGNFDTNPVEESIFQFMISVSGGEKWFIRTK